MRRQRTASSRSNRVAFISDHVDVGYIWAKGLRKRGIDVHIFHLWNPRPKGFAIWEDPTVKTPPDWYHILYPGARPVERNSPAAFFKSALRYHVDLARLLAELRSFEVVNSICNGLPCVAGPFGRFLVHALFNRCHWKRLIATQTGSDMREDAFKRNIRAWFVRRTFADADSVLVLSRDMIATARELNCRSRYIPYLFLPEQQEPAPEQLKWMEDLRRRTECRLLIFHPSPLDWVYQGNNRVLAGMKRNLMFLEAYARYIREFGDSQLVISRRGPDVASTEQFFSSNQMSDFVHWIDEPPDRNSFGGYVAGADVIVDQFGLGCVGMSSVHGLMQGKAVIAKIDEANYGDCPVDPVPTPPILSASSVDEVYDVLLRIRQLDQREEVGKKGAAWFKLVHDRETILDRLEDAFRG